MALSAGWVERRLQLFGRQQELGHRLGEPTFRDYINGPQVKIPSAKMVFPGLEPDQEIHDIIAFLKQFDADGKKKHPDRYAIQQRRR